MQNLISNLTKDANAIRLQANSTNIARRSATVHLKSCRTDGDKYDVVLHSAWADRQQYLNGLYQMQAIDAVQAHLGSDAVLGD